MYTRILKILCLIFSAYGAQAQADKDSLPTFGKTALFELTDVRQQRNTHILLDEKPLSLFIFLSPECPLCQNYTKTVNELQQKFKQQVNVYGIVPGNAYSIKEVVAFKKTYLTSFKVLIDKRQQLTRYLKAAVTPQAILLDEKGNLIYTGAIDDWVKGLGKKKLRISQQYVHDAIEQSLQLKQVTIKKTKAFGCKINDF